jgi:[glutamine synthetase] adenylyltransferase / [glutamine synthetase]-adenylyl-L-tyrosine phosphorylase
VGLDPDLGEAAAGLEAGGAIAPGFGAAMALLTRLLITLRLVSPVSEHPGEAVRPLVASVCGFDDWVSLERSYDAARSLIRSEWLRIADLD